MFLSDPFDHAQLCHVLPQPHMLELSIGKGHQIHKLMYACRSRMQLLLGMYMACAQGMCSREIYIPYSRKFDGELYLAVWWSCFTTAKFNPTNI